VQKINLFEAFPTGIREIPLSWGDSNLMKINVSLAYTEYTVEGSSVERNTSPQSGGLVKSKESENINLGITP